MSEHGSTTGTPIRLAENAAALALSRIAMSALMLVWHILLARQLGAALYGVYGTIGALMAVTATLADLGSGIIFVRDVARQPAESGRYLSAALALQGGLGALAYVALQIAGWLLGYDRVMVGLLAFVGVNLVIDALGTIGFNRFIAAERMTWPALISVGHVGLLVLLGSLAVAVGGGLRAVYAATAVAGTCRMLGFWIAMRRNGWRPRFPADLAVVRHLLVAGLPLGVAAFLSIGFLHADKIATTAIIGTAATGQLVAAFVIVFGTIELLGTTVLVALLPIMSRQGESAAGSGADPVLRQLLPFDVLIGLPVTAMLVTFGPTIAPMLFGPQFNQVAGLWSVMGWLIIVRMIENALAQALTVRERQTTVLVARAGGLLLNLCVTLALLSSIGVIGAAVGMLTGEACIVAAMVSVLGAPASWWRPLIAQLVRIGVAGAVLFLVLRAAAGSLPPIGAGVIGLIADGLVVVAIGAVTPEQRASVLQLLRDYGRVRVPFARPTE